MFRYLVTGLADLVFPPTCHHCFEGATTGSGISQPLCDTCYKLLVQLLGSHCPRCAAVYPNIHPAAMNCPHCQREDYAFTQTIAWGNYDSILREIILQMKDQSNESLAYQMGALFADQCRDKFNTLTFDAILPVPLHWTRRLWRGYNQAESLAQAIARTLSKPCYSHWLWRRLQTPKQTKVTPHQRRKNLKKAMAARIPKQFQGQRILLIDDVLTTGATADACARALLAAGAGNVTVAVLARAVGKIATTVTS